MRESSFTAMDWAQNSAREGGLIMKHKAILRLLAAVSALGVVCSAMAQLPGGIFTSTKTGTTVNGNIYQDAKDVYLNGGPQNANGSLLMDGIYFFQVTDPSGKTLLHTDSVWDRLVLVDAGRFAGRCDATGALLSMGPPKPPHPNGIYNPANGGGVPVQLWPYNQTPNNGGEYKAWLILWKIEVSDNPKVYSTETYSTPAADGVHLIFSKRWCKTDNFKVKIKKTPPLGTLQAIKFYDADMDGILDPEEFPVQNFGITFKLGNGAPLFQLTDVAGLTSVGDVPGGTTYQVCEVLPPDAQYGATPTASGWLQTAPGAIGDDPSDRCYNGSVTAELITLYFGNIQTGRLCGVKFYDADGDGVKDDGEVGIAGFTVVIDTVWPDGSTDHEEVVTGADGVWCSKAYPEGTDYTVTEDLGANSSWLQTYPSDGEWTGTIQGAGPTNGVYDVSYSIPDVTGLDFGNIQRCHFSGVKFYDRDMDGVQDAGEEGVAGITIHLELTLPDGTETTEDVVTGSDGSWETANLYPDGTTYEISETLPTTPGCWIQTAPAGGSYTGTLSGSGSPTDNTYELNCDDFNFGNILGAKLCGRKVYDADADGVVDPEDPGIQGFKISIEVTLPNGTVEIETVYTDANGDYCTAECYPEGSTYEVCEITPSSAWIQTYPANNACYTGTIPTSTGPYDEDSSLPDIEGLVFANIVLGGGGGHTPGYWHNQNGEATMMDGGTLQPELDALNALPLRNEDGSDADFANFQEFSDWLISTNGVNMANKLSSHVAAMFLNIEAGFVNAGSYIYAPGTTSAGALGFAEVGDVLAEAIAALAADGYTPSGDEPMRSYQTALKNALDAANNNTNFLSGPIVIVPPY